jgi:hypothetical protein
MPVSGRYNQTLPGPLRLGNADIDATNIQITGSFQYIGGVDVIYYVGGTAQVMDIRQGTLNTPISTGTGPTMKVSRTESIPASSMPSQNGQNNQGNAAIWAAAQGTASNQVQVSGILGTTITKSTQARTAVAPFVDPDACAVQGLGAVQGSGVGLGIGAYFAGRKDTTTGVANGTEIRSDNQSAVDDSYSATGISPSQGLWLTCGGDATGRLSGAASSLGLTGGCQWDVGYAGVTVGGTSAVKTAFISDDTSAATSIRVNGTHSSGALVVASGSGAVMIGETSLNQSSSLFEVNTGGTIADPLVNFLGTGSTSFSIRFANTAASAKIAMVGGAGNFITGSQPGDLVIQNTTASKRILIGGLTTIVMSITQGATLGFFTAAGSEVAQQNGTGNTHTVAAGSVTNVFVNTTFDGSTGSTAYTVGDIVLALKHYGLLAA